MMKPCIALHAVAVALLAATGASSEESGWPASLSDSKLSSWASAHATETPTNGGGFDGLGPDRGFGPSDLPFNGPLNASAWSSFVSASPSAYASWTSAHSTTAPPFATITDGVGPWNGSAPFGPGRWGPWRSGSAPSGPWKSWWGASGSGACPPSTWSGWTSGPWGMALRRSSVFYVS